jgi:membrane associated rhomboid family serine protease
MPQLDLRGRMTPAVKWLLGVAVATFLIWLFGNDSIKGEYVRWLVLTPGSLARGEVWKLLTTAVATVDGIGLLFNGLMLWLFVPQLERWWGARRFLTFLAITVLVGNLVSALVGLALGATLVPLHGLDPFILASIVAFGVLFANQQVALFGVINMRGRTLAIGFVVLQVMLTLIDRNWVRGAGTLAAMATAWLMTSGGFTPNLWLLRLRRWWLKKRYKVIDGGRKDKQKWVN